MSIITAHTEADICPESPTGPPADRRRTKSAACPPSGGADWDTPEKMLIEGHDMSPLSARQSRQDRSRTTRGARPIAVSQHPRPRRVTGPEQVIAEVEKESGSGHGHVGRDSKRGRDRRVSLPVEAPRRRATVAVHVESPRAAEDAMSPNLGYSRPQSAIPQRNRSVLEELSRWSEEREEESRRPMMSNVAGSSNAHKKRANRGGIRGWF